MSTIHEQVQSLASAVIDRIASDEEFREALKANPEGAMQVAGFTDQVAELSDAIEADTEVSGFASISPRLGQINLNTLVGSTIVASSPPSTAPTCGCAAGAVFPGSRFLGG